MPPSFSPSSDVVFVSCLYHGIPEFALIAILVYLFIGTLCLSDNILKEIAGSIIGLIGVVYIVLEFIPSIEPPANMR